ncbi:MAG TPA: hypothetical protein VJ867_15375 [Gemmatimonadaceae bacterium]|nr:hypothetical protein [Gemmatimonadaceae bacterium]
MPRGRLDTEVALNAARQEIADRIKRVCGDFGEDEFARLVDHMAEIEVRYRYRTDWLIPAVSRGELRAG